MTKLRKEIWLAGLIAVLAILVYLPALQNGFVNWDDEAYVVDNFAIRSLDISFLKWAFFEFSASNWHPLTWISHAVDYAIWGLNPFGHHLTNIVFHGLNTFLVVLLTLRLLNISRKLSHLASLEKTSFARGSILIPAAITGLQFGIHPIHVESVAWVSERKDVLYAFFYLLALLSYLKHSDTIKGAEEIAIFRDCSSHAYLVSLLFFVFSLMSKPMAITLPFVLLILDWYPLGRFQTRKGIRNAVIEKVPFMLLGLFSGIVTLTAQNSGNSYSVSLGNLPFSTRILVAFKALFLYIKNFLYPFDLIVLYRYPANVYLMSLEYLMPILLFAAVTTVCIFLLKSRKYLLAAWAFYVVTLLPVLGIIQVGWQSMADRYVYLALLGPSVLLGLMVEFVYMKIGLRPKRKFLPYAVLAGCFMGIIIILICTSIRQIRTWKDGVTLWSRAIEIEPAFPEAYQRRGIAFRKRGQYFEAITDFTTAITLDPFTQADYYNERGVCYAGIGFFNKALEDFETAISIKPALTIYQKNRQEALKDIERVQKEKVVKPEQ